MEPFINEIEEMRIEFDQLWPRNRVINARKSTSATMSTTSRDSSPAQVYGSPAVSPPIIAPIGTPKGALFIARRPNNERVYPPPPGLSNSPIKTNHPVWDPDFKLFAKRERVLKHLEDKENLGVSPSQLLCSQSSQRGALQFDSKSTFPSLKQSTQNTISTLAPQNSTCTHLARKPARVPSWYTLQPPTLRKLTWPEYTDVDSRLMRMREIEKLGWKQISKSLDGEHCSRDLRERYYRHKRHCIDVWEFMFGRNALALLPPGVLFQYPKTTKYSHDDQSLFCIVETSPILCWDTVHAKMDFAYDYEQLEPWYEHLLAANREKWKELFGDKPYMATGHLL